MKAKCHDCGLERDLEPFNGLCIDCLIAMAKRSTPDPIKGEALPHDWKKDQAGERE